MRVLTVRVQSVVFPIVQDGDETYWPIRLISESIGVGWGAQYSKLQPPRYNVQNVEFLVPGKKSPESHVCLSRYEFEFWLKTINVRKISPEARQRLTLLRQHFFGSGTKFLAAGEGVTQSSATMDRLMEWKLRSLPHEQRAAAKHIIEQRFIEQHGCSMRDVAGSELVQGVSTLVAIISIFDKNLDVTDLTVSARVDAFIDKMISDAQGGEGHIHYETVAALLCAIELEQTQSV